MARKRIEEPTMEDLLTKWEQPENLKLVEEWAGQGLTLASIAHNMGIGRSTLFDWRKKSAAIGDAFKKGDDHAVETAENTLFWLATEGKNIAALIFYLKNKRPNKWRDKRDTELTGSGAVKFEWDGKDKGKDGNNNDTIQAAPDMGEGDSSGS